MFVCSLMLWIRKKIVKNSRIYPWPLKSLFQGQILTFALSMTQGQWRGRGEKVIPLECLIFVSPLAFHVVVLYFCKSHCLSRWRALFSWVPLPLTLGYFIFVSPLASHVGVLYFCEFPCLSRFRVYGAAYREVSQLGNVYIVQRTVLRKEHKWHLRLVPCLGKWRPTNRVGGSL